MEDSFTLLSSMSPKVDRTKKTTIKKATKLALKKQVRKSLAYDNKSKIRNHSVICTISTSSDEVSSNEDVIRKRSENMVDGSVIIIESSSDADSVNSNESDKETYKTAGSVISESEIEDSRIKSNDKITADAPCLKQNSCSGSLTEPDDFSQNNLDDFDELTKKDLNNKELTEKESSHSENTYSKKCINNIIQKYLQDDISEVKTGTASPFVLKWIKDLDVNFDNIDDINNTTSGESRLPRFSEILEKNREITTANKKPSDGLLDDNNGFAETRDTEHYPSTPKLLDDQEKLLDELYGPLWRDSQEKLKPKSEKKNPTRQVLIPSTNKCKTDVKVNRSITYKNPHLDSEKKKSNLLRTLHTARLRINMETPWSEHLKNICDSDTASDKENKSGNVIGRKLNFDDDDDEDSKSNNVNRKNSSLAENHQRIEAKTKIIRKKKPSRSKQKYEVSSSSDTSEDSDSSNDEYFRSKVKQNIARKANVQKRDDVQSFLSSLSMSVSIVNCDPSARIYRENFKIHKEELAKKLFNLFNENVFENKLADDMLLEWNDRMRGTAGYCYCKKITRRTGVVERDARIVLSTKVVDSADRLRDTLVHEMCHAATWVVNEVSDGHGSFWKAWAYKAIKVYPELPPIKRCHDYAINTKYTYKCTDCGYSFGRHSKSLDIERKRCGYCFGKFEVLINKKTKDGIKTVPATPQKKPSAFAEFVKQNYKTVRTESLKHGDVMKILSKQFNEMKLDQK